MNDTSDKFNRSVALDKAMEFYKDQRVHRDTLIETAELFRVFLSGEGTKPEPFETRDTRPVFKLPTANDGYVYFRLLGFDVLYRSPHAIGSRVEATERINSRSQTSWHLATGSLATRQGLWDNPEYSMINAKTAAVILEKNIKGYRFE